MISASGTLNIYANTEMDYTYYVTARSGLNIRVEPNITADKIDAVPYGAEVLVVNGGEQSEWTEINYEGQTAYVYSRYITDDTKEISTKEENVKLNNYLGKFKLTYYCNCSICCGKWAGGATASGTSPVEGRTIAVDPNVISLGSQVVIGGDTYTAEDTGSGIKGNRIDVYVESHQRALQLGVKTADVYVN